MNAIIKITGTQSADGETDVIELTTNGTLEPSDDGWILCYNETEATGMEGTVTRLELSPGRLDLGTYTSELAYKLNNSGGELLFSYTLGFNGGISSAHTVHITVQEEK